MAIAVWKIKIIIIFRKIFGNSNELCYICNVIEEMKSDDTDSKF